MSRVSSVALIALLLPGIIVLNTAIGHCEFQMVSLTYQYDPDDLPGGFNPANITKFGNGVGAQAEGYGQNSYGSYFDTIVEAKSSLLPFSLLHASASAISVGNFAYGNDAKAVATAGYRDTITVVNGIAPDVLRLRFGVEGELHATQTVYPASAAVFVYGVTGGIAPVAAALSNWNNSVDESNGPLVSWTAVQGRFDLGNAAGFDVSSDPAGGISIGGEVDLDVPLTDGQYNFAVLLSAYAYVHGPQGTQFAISDFGNTLKFQGVSLTDGTPFDTTNLRFESGLSFDSTPVPEPSGFVLAAIGGCALWLGRRRLHLADL